MRSNTLTAANRENEEATDRLRADVDPSVRYHAPSSATRQNLRSSETTFTATPRVSKKHLERDNGMTKIMDSKPRGWLVRERQKQASLTLKDAAGMSGVGVRFVQEL